MQFSFLALIIAGVAIIPSTANVIKPIPVGTSLDATSTSTSLIPTTTTNLGVPLQPSSITANIPTATPNKGCEYSHYSPSPQNYLPFFLTFPLE